MMSLAGALIRADLCWREVSGRLDHNGFKQRQRHN